jgi:hypothetical protein
MHKKTLSSALLILAIASSHAENTNTAPLSGYVYNAQGCYGFTAPHGWKLDNKILADQGVGMAFYPADSNWDNASMAIYTQIYTNPHAENSDTLIAAEINTLREMYKADNIEIHAKKLETIRSKAGSEGELWQLNYSNGLEEQIAYFPIPPKSLGVFVLQMDARTDKSKATAALRTLAESYQPRQTCKPCAQANACKTATP